MTAPYPHLFAPLTVGRVALPNRILMGSMHTGLEEAEGGAERLAAFFAERARGGVALMVTGGYSPNPEGRMAPQASVFDSEAQIPDHRRVTDAVHAAGGRILLQILHTGRYGLHPDCVAPSPLRAPINRFTPRELTEADILRTVADFARCAALAERAGYDGVEVMGSEGYLINEFTAPRTNRRTDAWGGPFENRSRFPLEILRAVRAAVSPGFIVMYRLSVLDLVEDGSPFAEVAALAKAVAAAGADVINSGVGWHEARIPTIAHMVPPAGWAWATARLKGLVDIPVVASNRINTPEAAEALLARGDADMVSMARPFLADPAFPAKAREGRAAEINTCIACNQACLDFIFSGRVCSCLVNPRACHETTFEAPQAEAPKRVAVVGGGPAGLACAAEAAARGHRVTLFEAAEEIGGQFRLARAIPGKADYDHMIRYFEARLEALGVDVRLGRAAAPADLAPFDAVVLATGIRPRAASIPGADHASVASYLDILTGRRDAGRRVAIVGAGGVAFDVALHLLGEDEDFFAEWGVDRDPSSRGGLATPAPCPPARSIVMMQRKAGRPGADLGKTTGWIHRLALERRGVEMLSGVTYRRIDDAGLHVSVAGAERVIPADTIVVCAGQEPLRELYDALAAAGRPVHLIGGAADAAALDARRAIEEGTRLGLAL
ncbi:MAG: FAD-dependent oxidoreductase [Rhodospirillales bacterium]|nr:FAD-dependent oxidoreductase [Rhodospirillales bacterium]